MKPESGLTPEEQKVSDALVKAWNTFMSFTDAIPTDELQEFREAIHAAQRVLLIRIVRRLYPEYWR